MLENFLKIKQRKILASAMFVLAFLMALPPTLTPDDFINLFAAKFLITSFGIEMIFALVLTYTLIPFAIVVAGIYIYPKSNGAVARMLVNRVKRPIRGFISKSQKNPMYAVIVLVVAYILFSLYAEILRGML